MSNDNFLDEFFEEGKKAVRSEDKPVEIEGSIASVLNGDNFSQQGVDVNNNAKIKLPSIAGDYIPPKFMEMTNRVLAQYEDLPYLDYDNLHKEIAGLSFRSSKTATLQSVNRELQKTQAIKERLSEIMTDVLRCYTLKKRAVDILRDGWCIFSSESSADKRKSDSIYRLNEFDMDFAQVECLMKAASHIAKNLDGLQESLSRRITIFQLQLKMFDLGRDSLPDIEGEDIDDNFGFGNKDGDLSPKEGSF